MSNFTFLNHEWSSLYAKMKKAEQNVYTDSIMSAFTCRLVLEECIHKIYAFEHLEKPYNTTLNSLITDEEFKRILPYKYKDGIHIVKTTGNNAAHYGRRVSGKDAMISMRYLFEFLKWFADTYSETIPTLPGMFDESAVPKLGEKQRKLKEIQAEQEKAHQALLDEIAALKAQHDAVLEKAQRSDEALAEYQQNEAAAKAKIQAQKQERIAKIPSEFNEAETRLHLIDVALNEAGWNKLRKGRELEYAVKGMPITGDNPKGNGFVDYVLWDDNGLPLALIEAKRTSKDIEVGKHQAFLYANCLEQMHGQRPIIFYTNGYETKLWDDQFYSTPRPVYGFYTKDELQWEIQKRATLKDLRNATINKEIAGKGRPYQVEAIQRVAESFVVDGTNGELRGAKRKVLLVMATGSGKTRTAAALVDVLFKNNWIKRVLFLADRNALVRQAKNSFGDYLPDLTAINLGEEKENDTTRLVFSTYQTMIHRIDAVESTDERFYGIGHFDLIIVDEAHRSIYNRYKAIFEYFDALVVGLTATPKDGIDHNTFELFGCSNEDPTFLYTLEEAVPTFLSPYKNIDITTDFLREGIKYNELSDKEKQKYEETFAEHGEDFLPEVIGANALNKWLFNKDTVNKVLDAYMEQGLKIEGGDKIGRTIIFAVNQKHAKFIVDCFTERYPQFPSGFISMIHNQVSHAQTLIDDFCDHYTEKNPQIAVSVDMMDTGIDAPRVLNLVFFKVVRSYAKFWQMIGRGTRLCPDVYGPNEAKDHFLIFDVCGNFEFFEVQKKGKETKIQKPISRQIFESRLQLSKLLIESHEEENIAWAQELRDLLHHQIKSLDKKRFQVAMQMRYVDEFSKRERWNNLSVHDIHEIDTYLSGLPEPEQINELARRFDLMMLRLQIANLAAGYIELSYQDKLTKIGYGLSLKLGVPEVLKSRELIENLQTSGFYLHLTLKKTEEIRTELREIIHYLKTESRTIIYSDLIDSEVTSTGRISDISTSYGPSAYKNRVEAFIRENKHQLTISKLNSNLAITEEELKLLESILFDGTERGTLEDFIKEFGEEPLGVFIRHIVGLDVKAAQEAFSEFLEAGNLTANQMVFIQNIIDHLTKNGTIAPEMLFESPFTDANQDGVVGLFDNGQAQRIVSIINEINENALGA